MTLLVSKYPPFRVKLVLPKIDKRNMDDHKT